MPPIPPLDPLAASGNANPQSTDVSAVVLICPKENGPLPEAALIALLEGVIPDAQTEYAAALSETRPGSTGLTVIALRDPVSALSWRLASGKAPALALSEWQADMQQLLERQRRARRRITLLDPDFARAPDPEALRLFAERLGGRVDADLPERLAAGPDMSAETSPEAGSETLIAPETSSIQAPALRLMALHLLTDPSCTALLAELEAVTFAPQRRRDHLAETEAAWAVLQSQSMEIAYLRDHLALQLAAQEEAQSAAQTEAAERAAQARMQAAAARSEMDVLEARLQRSHDEAAQQQAEIALLRDHLALQLAAQEEAQGAAQAEAAERAAQARSIEAERQLLNATNAALTRRLETALQHSIGRETVLALQLLADGDLGVEKEAMEQERNALREDLARLHGEIGGLNNEIGTLHGEVGALRASRSWRLTAPLRALSRRGR